MKLLNDEKLIWEAKNKNLLLTTHRLREVRKSIFGSVIKSIMLEELTSSQLHVSLQFKYIKQALWYFILINGFVFLLNQFLFKAELIKLLFGEIHIGPPAITYIFYMSLVISIYYIVKFITSFKKVFSFYATGMTINFQLRWMDFNDRENFISMVEQAKCDRELNIIGDK
jgi:hypothetical protein